MRLRKLLCAAAIAGVALAGNPGQAVADTATHDFRIVKIGANTGTVIAYGPFYGVGTEENTRHQVPLGSPFQVRFDFAHGSLSASARPGPPQIVSDPVTCVTRVTLQVANVITGGTGDYAGVSGTGSGTSSITLIRGRADDGSCLGPATPPIFEIAVVQARFTLTLP